MYRYQTSTEIFFGVDSAKECGSILKEKGHNRIMIVSDQGIVDAGLVDIVTSSLTGAGLQTHVFPEIKPNPSEKNVHDGSVFLKEKNCDALIALGGGSPIDAAKAISIVTVNNGDILALEYGKEPINEKGVPVYTIPTTSGTGSEVTCWSVITDTEKKRKFDVGSPLMAPTAAFDDPKLTLSLPKTMTAATGMDALCHAVEAYTTKNVNPIVEGTLLASVKLIGENLLQAYQNGQDLDARSNMMRASLLAGMCFPNSGLGAVHGMTAPLGGHFDVPHGIANAIMMPYVMEFNAPECEKRYTELAEALGAEERSPAGIIKHIKNMNEQMNMPTLSEFDIKEGDLEMLAKDSIGPNSNCNSNPREINVEDAIAIFQNALTEK